jgi:hypothetical protein
MFKFYIPFYYLIHTRLRTNIDLLSWQIIFIIPQFTITYFYLNIRSDIFVLIFFITQLAFHTLYEIGYIENDNLTTKNEKKPTLRLNRGGAAFIKKNYSKVIYVKYLIVLLFIGLLYWINTFVAYRLNIFSFISLLVLNRIFFFLHNNIRSRLNILTFFLLSVTKFIFPVVLFIRFETLLYPILLSVIIFPLLRTIEISTLRRHNLKIFSKIINDIDRFRILYYLVNLLLLIVVWYLSFLSIKNFGVSIFILVYFLLFRISTYFLIKEGVYKRDIKTKTNVHYKLK